MAKLRCFFGPKHGKWLEPSNAGSDYFEVTMAQPAWCALVHHSKQQQDAYDWLFTYDAGHPHSENDSNHPTNLQT